MPSYTWIDETIEHSDEDCTRAAGIARRISKLRDAAEQRQFARQAQYEDGLDHEPEFEDEAERNDHLKRLSDREQDLELEEETLERMLEKLGARMMRPYEHWGEDELLVQYQETRYDNEY